MTNKIFKAGVAFLHSDFALIVNMEREKRDTRESIESDKTSHSDLGFSQLKLIYYTLICNLLETIPSMISVVEINSVLGK